MSLDLNEILQVYGRIPNFHDSELIDFSFESNLNLLKMKYYSFAFGDIDLITGKYQLKNKCNITYYFNSVYSFKMEDAFSQNIASEIRFAKRDGYVEFIHESAVGAYIEVRAKGLTAKVADLVEVT